ncbi:hypothetical protein [Pseudoduganella namucuonensis]|nr:hypothetical protein [Pseudoduganella namucuonensis]
MKGATALERLYAELGASHDRAPESRKNVKEPVNKKEGKAELKKAA